MSGLFGTLAYLDFFFRSGRWVSAEAATLFTAFGVLGLLSNFDAVVPTFFDVFSLRAMGWPPYPLRAGFGRIPLPRRSGKCWGL